jgi:hypothetical protein
MIATRSLLVTTLLALGVAAVAPAPASAATMAQQDETRPGELEGRSVEIKLLGRKLMERVEDHRERLLRVDKLIQFHRAQGNSGKIRELERLRQREVAAFQKTLSEYRKILGDQDFERLGRAVRFFVERERKATAGADSQRNATGTQRTGRPSRSQPTRAPTPSVERTLDRQLRLERARASQRMQLAQRLQQARQQQLRLMAEQQRRYQPPAGLGSSQGGPTRRPAAGTQGGPTRRPSATQRPGSQRRRP